MEDVYTIKVKTKPDTRNLYPSERRYSASTVSGLAWVHIALAATSFLLACLALVNPSSDIKRITLNDTEQKTVNANDLFNETNSNSTAMNSSNDSSYILVLAPTLITVFALAAGIASIMASVRWYIDNNITWLFGMSILSTLFSFVSFVMIAAWFISTSGDDISDFYKDKEPFKDFIIVKHDAVIDRNESHILIAHNSSMKVENSPQLFTKRVLSINILIAAFLELLWSLLSLKISYKGMKNNYKDDDTERRGNRISVVTKIKGNNTKKLPRNAKILPPKPDLIDHYPNKNIKHIFLAQNENGFYLKNQNNKSKHNTETSSEFYKERMLSFLNKCASMDGISNPEMPTPSIQSESVLNPIPEITNVEINTPERNPDPEVKSRMTPISWGDTPEHTIYNQNTLNLEKIFKFGGKLVQDDAESKKTDVQSSEEMSEIVENV